MYQIVILNKSNLQKRPVGKPMDWGKASYWMKRIKVLCDNSVIVAARKV